MAFVFILAIKWAAISIGFIGFAGVFFSLGMWLGLAACEYEAACDREPEVLDVGAYVGLGPSEN